METDYLREFIDLSDTLNFTQSAKRLNVSQPTLSRHISALEKEAGVPLFDRSFDAVHLTRAGRIFYNKACGIIKELDAAMTDVGDASSEQLTTLTMCGSLFQPTVNRFMSRMTIRAESEGLPIRFIHTHMYASTSEPLPSATTDLLDSGKTDFLIDYFPPSPDKFDSSNSFKICSEPLYFFASKSNPLANTKSLKLADLSGEKFVLLSERSQSLGPYEGIIRDGGCSLKDFHALLIHDFLEIPECLNQLESDEIIPIQANFAILHGLLDEDMERSCILDLHDSYAKLYFYLMWRKSDNRSAIRTAVKLAHEVKESFRPDQSAISYQLAVPDWNV